MNDRPDTPRWPHGDGMHLLLTSLGEVVVDARGVRSLRAQDASGSFGLWPGHADFLTVLGAGVLSWRAGDDVWHHCAVRRGVLTMRRGCELAVATREAVPGDDLLGLAVGAWHFGSLRWFCRRLVDAQPGRGWRLAALQGLRLVVLLAAGLAAARQGAAPLLAMPAGLLVARALVLRRVQRAPQDPPWPRPDR
jgi:alternate F1F0 ATPase F1 subunit epsilon